MAQPRVPDVVISRLPLYLRTLKQVTREGYTVISSQELGERLGLSAAQIRKDLSFFGEFGVQGVGYDVANLIRVLERILHVDRIWDMIVVGVGALGTALAHYQGFTENGFRIVALYDNDPQKVGQVIGGIPIRDVKFMVQDIRENGWRIGILAVPSTAAQDVADAMVEGGIRAILSYAPTVLSVPADVHVQYIDPIGHLQHMTYYLGEEDVHE